MLAGSHICESRRLTALVAAMALRCDSYRKKHVDRSASLSYCCRPMYCCGTHYIAAVPPYAMGRSTTSSALCTSSMLPNSTLSSSSGSTDDELLPLLEGCY